MSRVTHYFGDDCPGGHLDDCPAFEAVGHCDICGKEHNVKA